MVITMMKIDIMKILILFVLMSSSIALSGCTSNPGEVSEQSNKIMENKSGVLPQDMPYEEKRAMNLSDAERQKLMEERQQKLLEACNGKKEGDGCNFTGPRGEEAGTCNIQKDQLMCSPEGFRGDI